MAKKGVVRSKPEYSREQIDLLIRFWDDARQLIAAGKIQRWEVVKWAVTLNVALATASATIGTFQIGFVAFSFFAAVMGIMLVNHYNYRMTRARRRMQNLSYHFQQNFIDINSIAQALYDKEKTINYDEQEMRIFRFAIILSIVPSIISLTTT